MTLAICYQNGSPKRGAFLACPVCRLEPGTPQDMAPSLAMSSHFFTASDLVQVKQNFKVGKKSELSEETQPANCLNNFRTSFDKGRHCEIKVAKIAGIRHE